MEGQVSLEIPDGVVFFFDWSQGGEDGVSTLVGGLEVVLASLDIKG